MLLYIKNRRVVDIQTEIVFTFTELVREGHTKKNGYKKIASLLLGYGITLSLIYDDDVVYGLRLLVAEEAWWNVLAALGHTQGLPNRHTIFDWWTS